jgi:hypothetical protein
LPSDGLLTDRERKLGLVHPNSMAARKWKRSTWLYAESARARRRGDVELAAAYKRQAARQSATSFHCG